MCELFWILSRSNEKARMIFNKLHGEGENIKQKKQTRKGIKRSVK